MPKVSGKSPSQDSTYQPGKPMAVPRLTHLSQQSKTKNKGQRKEKKIQIVLKVDSFEVLKLIFKQRLLRLEVACLGPAVSVGFPGSKRGSSGSRSVCD